MLWGRVLTVAAAFRLKAFWTLLSSMLHGRAQTANFGPEATVLGVTPHQDVAPDVA
jgi:hypothetical protein